MNKENNFEKYDFSLREKYWQDFWQEEGIYNFNPESSKPIYSIDTPPPTISGSLHLGHVYSYTQAEVIARFKRMTGRNVRYPIGFDNNGLPTERLVEKEKGIKGEKMDRAEFIKECLEITAKYEKEYQNLFQSLGFSIDWNLNYSTIEERVQKIVQTVFKDFFERNIIYRQEFPVIYCTECKTSIAQAEVEDKELPAVFYDLLFKTIDGQDLIIATTRPEYLPACVAVLIHPDDKRYKDLVGQKALTPLGRQVPIITDDKVDMEKGTGIVMCCTYGDDTDVYWVKKHNLSEIKLLKKDGSFNKTPEAEELNGKNIKEAREIMVARLKKGGKIINEKPFNHNVGVHERCGTPIEFISTIQWFVKIMDIKEKLLALGSEVKWHPAYMEKRFIDWINGLKWDWCISRERFYGIPIPIFTCLDCQKVFVPNGEKLPIDPRLGGRGIMCPGCKKNNLKPENDVLDTWFTSSLTPEINNSHPNNGKWQNRILPMSMRPQAHDIIRTWAFYTIAMNYYRLQQKPWEELMVAGHILLRKGEKISKKSGGGKYKPSELISTHSADAVRYTMCGASLGIDAYFEEKELAKGKKLVNKLYNATKLVLMLIDDNKIDSESELTDIDNWIINKSEQIAKRMADKMSDYEVGNARIVFEEFFWSDFCDNYLELAKARLFSDKINDNEKKSTQLALVKTLLNILKMASIYTPHICEELYHSELLKDEDKTIL
ncbi:MAG TPA: valine--tRNA ligase, partial [Candidatus Vogelbacteria bacterium]|nr:valine--tRNA ligase [Candidatus Vogelbacteria bacterium]